MARGQSMTLSFPQFRGFVRALVLWNTGIFLLMLLLQYVMPRLADSIESIFWLLPIAVIRHGFVWQTVTYSFLHAGVLHILFNMLSLWFVGSYLEDSLGQRRLAELYFVSVIGAALSTIAVSYTGVFHLSPNTPTVGASGGIFGLLVAFAVLYGDVEFMLFPLPFRIKAKYLVTVYILVSVAMLMSGGGSNVAYLAHLGGALFGYIYIRISGRRGFSYVASEWYFGLRNNYYRAKRRRAAKKFQVYMSKQHGKDVSIPPEARGPGDPSNPSGPPRKKPTDPNDRRWMN